ncbi:MAG: DUF3795 domain-containing protein [Deltaproteobacteria bacterium]|nr:DUF3795 domain-containing protein [Deltaproteobacteria bacterium]MBW1952420.1 DUF3795 domain-containing protein [Deltaproteobacteria bacterium]MBW2134871.1 DUF3795 domain-containing protein [Deltaproteobacteria bacterium]
MIRESYCGLCDDCQLGNRDFLESVAQLKEYVDQFRADWWVHCFPDGEGFSFAEFRKGINWFLSHTECPGCKGGRGLENCPIRICARQRHIEHCYECPDLKGCDKFDHLLIEFPDLKINLLRRQLKYKACQYHRHLDQAK